MNIMQLKLTQEIIDAAFEQMDISVSEKRKEFAIKLAVFKDKLSAKIADKIDSYSLLDQNNKKRTKDIFEGLANADEDVIELRKKVIYYTEEVQLIDERFKRAQMVLSVYKAEKNTLERGRDTNR